ncbi:MAG: PTS ascorbate transporter subunit IIC [Leptolinea sp.]|nr:PTS ascorbate transporter subunit IIC [Leptolinea sp.]
MDALKTILDILVQVMSKPAILVGLIAMVGLIFQKKPLEIIISGTVKTIMGFLILSGGANIVILAITPLGSLMQQGFGLQGVLPVNEVFTAEAQKMYGTAISFVFFFAFMINLLLARLTAMKYVFLTGHHTLFAATLVTGILGLTVFKGGSQVMLIAISSVIVGGMMVFFPWLSAPFMEKVIGSRDFVMGHFGTTNYVLAGWLGSKVGDPKDSTENIRFPRWIGFMREPLIAMGSVMTIIYFIASIAALNKVGMDDVVMIYGNSDEWWLNSLIEGLTFAGGIGVILLGVRMILADIVPAFRGFAEKIVPEAIPALDCPVVFPYGQNAVLVGYLSSIAGGVLAMSLQVITLPAGESMGVLGGVILPSMIIHFFCGGTSGVFGNATGGWKGAVLGGFLCGLIFTLLAGTSLRAVTAIGIPDSCFGDPDFGVVGSLLAYVTGLFK